MSPKTAMKPRALDLFCGAGGAARGLQLAGFHVTGIDIARQPRYAGDLFIQGDAMVAPVRLSDFDLVWASPPCQGYSIMRNLPWNRHRAYPLLIDATRDMLRASAREWVIENVMGAKLNGGYLCGGMFGLNCYRHRAFESSFFWLQPAHRRHEHTVRNGRKLGSRARDIIHNGCTRVGANIGHAAGVAIAREEMGVPWMKRDEVTQAIPPAYAEHIGRYAMLALDASRVPGMESPP